LRASNDFAEVCTPHPKWLMAVACVPDTPPDSKHLRDLGFFFAEGRDRVGDTLTAKAADADSLSIEEVQSLPGDFSFLKLDARGDLLAVKACAGVVPLYYATPGTSVILATQLAWVARLLPEEPTLDAISNICWLSGLAKLTVGRSLLEGVASLEGGTMLALPLHGRPSVVNYWKRPLVDALLPNRDAQKQNYVERISSIITESVQLNLDPLGRNLLSLSSGVDSAIVASLTRRRTCHEFRTHSILFEDPSTRRRDESYLDTLEKELGLTATRVVHRTPQQSLALRREHSPPCLIQIAKDEYCTLADDVTQHGTRVFFNGHFADTLFDARGQQTLDWVRMSPFSAIFFEKNRPASRGTLLSDWARWHALTSRDIRPRRCIPPLTSLANQRVQEQYRAWYSERWQAKGSASIESNTSFRWDVHQRLREEVYLGTHWEVGSLQGARYFFPFFTRELLELAYTIHPSHHLPGPKELLRSAFRDCVPAYNLDRPDKGELRPPAQISVAWGGAALPRELFPILSAEFFPELPAKLPSDVALRLERVVGIVRRLCLIRKSYPLRVE